MDRILVSPTFLQPCFHRILNQFYSAPMDRLTLRETVQKQLQRVENEILENSYLPYCHLEKQESSSGAIYLHIDVDTNLIPPELFTYFQIFLWKPKGTVTNLVKVPPYALAPLQSFLLRMSVKTFLQQQKEFSEQTKVSLRDKFNQLMDSKLRYLMNNQTRTSEQLKSLVNSAIPDFYDKTEIYQFLDQNDNAPIVVSHFVKHFQLNLSKTPVSTDLFVYRQSNPFSNPVFYNKKIRRDLLELWKTHEITLDQVQQRYQKLKRPIT